MNDTLRAAGLPELVCDVCFAEPAVGVAAVPGVPVSMAYGGNCLSAGAHPYAILVANATCCDGLGNTSEWWREMVTTTLDYLGIPHEVFYRDVADILREEAAHFRALQQDTEPAPSHFPDVRDAPFGEWDT